MNDSIYFQQFGVDVYVPRMAPSNDPLTLWQVSHPKYLVIIEKSPTDIELAVLKKLLAAIKWPLDEVQVQTPDSLIGKDYSNILVLGLDIYKAQDVPTKVENTFYVYSLAEMMADMAKKRASWIALNPSND